MKKMKHIVIKGDFIKTNFCNGYIKKHEFEVIKSFEFIDLTPVDICELIYTGYLKPNWNIYE